MVSTRVARAAVPVAAFGLALSMPATAFAADDPLGGELNLGGASHAGATVAQATIASMNGTQAGGQALIALNGRQAHVTFFMSNLQSGMYTQQLRVGGNGTCPTLSADANGNGEVSTDEGASVFGTLGGSLTTPAGSGAAGGAAGVQLPSPANGVLTYDRVITVSRKVADKIRAGEATLVTSKVPDSVPAEQLGGAAQGAASIAGSTPVACGDLQDRSSALLEKVDLDRDLSWEGLREIDQLNQFFSKFEQLRSKAGNAGDAGRRVADSVRSGLSPEEALDKVRDTPAGERVEDVTTGARERLDEATEGVRQQLGDLRFF